MESKNTQMLLKLAKEVRVLAEEETSKATLKCAHILSAATGLTALKQKIGKVGNV